MTLSLATSIDLRVVSLKAVVAERNLVFASQP
jgi:hypothetical protein